MFPVICGSELRRDELRTVRPVSLLPRCCKQAPARCFLSRVKFNVKNPGGGKNSAKNNFFFALLRKCPINHFQANCDRKCRVAAGQALGERMDGEHKTDGFTFRSAVGKFACVLRVALVFCGLPHQLRKMPLCLFHDSCW